MATAKKKKTESAYPQDITRLVDAKHYNPYGVLGRLPAKKGEGGRIRAFYPHARAVSVVTEAGESPMERVHPHGVFEAEFELLPSSYKLRVDERDSGERLLEDPYADDFHVRIPDTDLYLIGEGTHYRTYDYMGAHALEINGVGGVRFAVWAPCAERVSVIGDFNRWDGRSHCMQSLGASGSVGESIWVSAAGSGDIYGH